MKDYFFLPLLFISFFSMSQTVGINTSGAVPSTSAMLDVSASNKGLLIPRVNIIDLNTDVPVSSPVTSLLVYNTNTTSGVGYYFWNGSKWVNLKDADSNADEDWHEVGTTNSPDNINDDIFTMGKVGVGGAPLADFDVRSLVLDTLKSVLARLPEGNSTGKGTYLGVFSHGSQPASITSFSIQHRFYDIINSSINFLRGSTDDDGEISFGTMNLERMRIDNNGNVGIGTSTPTSSLHVITPASSSSGNIRIVSGSSNGDVVDVTGSSSEVYLDHFVGATFTATAPTVLNQAATFKVDQEPTLGANVTVTDNMALWVESGNSCFGGNVGVGLTNPLTKLHVVSSDIGDNVNDEQSLFILQTSPTGGNSLYLDFKNRRHIAGSNWYGTNGRLQRRIDGTAQAFIDFGIDGVSASYGLGFGTRNGIGGTQQTRMVIDDNGNVGIGTTTPSSRLHVKNGTLLMDGNSSQIYLKASAGSIDPGDIVFVNGDGTNKARIWADPIQNQGLQLNGSGNGTVHMKIDASGNVGIGNAPSYKLHVSTNSAAKPTSSAWTIASDRRLKTNIKTYEGGLNDILKIKPVWFTYTGKAGMPKDTGVGIIAQDLQKIAPYMVSDWTYDNEGTKENYLGVDNGAMTYMLINAVKELKAENDLLKKELKDIKLLINSLK